MKKPKNLQKHKKIGVYRAKIRVITISWGSSNRYSTEDPQENPRLEVSLVTALMNLTKTWARRLVPTNLIISSRDSLTTPIHKRSHNCSCLPKMKINLKRSSISWKTTCKSWVEKSEESKAKIKIRVLKVLLLGNWEYLFSIPLNLSKPIVNSCWKIYEITVKKIKKIKINQFKSCSNSLRAPCKIRKKSTQSTTFLK